LLQYYVAKKILWCIANKGKRKKLQATQTYK